MMAEAMKISDCGRKRFYQLSLGVPGIIRHRTSPPAASPFIFVDIHSRHVRRDY